jgi:DNA repair exonuclease SbcCD ATPase subunit
MDNIGSEAARQLASMRRLHRKVCPVCGTEFDGIARRVYDRLACQVKAYRKRKKERSPHRADR